MESADRVARMGVTVVYSPCPGVVDSVTLSIASGATVGEALRASGLQTRHPDFDAAPVPAGGWVGVSVGVWGRLCDASRVLREGDRVEVYRPLRVDPKEARRRRYRQGRGGVAGAGRPDDSGVVKR